MAGVSANQVRLVTAQLFSGAGIASGFAVGGLLAEEITGKTAMAGFAQMSVILGAGLIAYPLAALAGRKGRRTALTLGFGTGLCGAAIVLLAVALAFLPLLMLGMMMCGACTAAGLQARYAAVDTVRPEAAGRAMSIVVWATTIGSVLGPNFTEPGAKLGETFGMNPLAGPYLISMGAFALATLAASNLTKGMAAAPSGMRAVERLGLREALRYAGGNPVPLFAMVTIITGQMMMTNVMVMTPVHMDHQAFSLALIGIVISVHIAGMYGLSPLFGWVADRWGPGVVIVCGGLAFVMSILLGILDALAAASSMTLLTIALMLLGVGWSMFLIGGSALLTVSAPPNAKLTLQGASDSAMNLGGALMAALAGPVLESGGFLWINLMACVVLAITLAFAVRAVPLMRWPGREPVPAAVE